MLFEEFVIRCEQLAKEELVYLESSRTPEMSHGFQDCFPQTPRQSTAVRKVCFKGKLFQKATNYSTIKKTKNLTPNSGSFPHFAFKRKLVWATANYGAVLGNLCKCGKEH